MHPICSNSLEHCIRHTGTSIHVLYFHFELLLSSSSSKLDEVLTNEIILTHCVHLELYKLIMYRCIFELFGRQKSALFYQCRCYLLLFTELCMNTPNHNQFDSCIVRPVDFIHMPR